jgi:hypothetical protein
MARKLAASLSYRGGNATEVLQFGEEAFDQVALTIEPLAEAGFPFSVEFRWYVRCGTVSSIKVRMRSAS